MAQVLNKINKKELSLCFKLWKKGIFRKPIKLVLINSILKEKIFLNKSIQITKNGMVSMRIMKNRTLKYYDGNYYLYLNYLNATYLFLSITTLKNWVSLCIRVK